MQDYWHKPYGCPFYQRNSVTTLVCESGAIKFHTKKAMREFQETCIEGYKECPIAKALEVDYDEMERIKREDEARVTR